MYLKFQHKGIELYFIQNGEFVETIPMDLTSFILWHLENNRDLTDFFNKFKFKNLETTNTLPEKISRFIKYLNIYDIAKALLTISQGLNDFILNQENITRDEIIEQIINCFTNLEFENVLIATKRNNLIWNYLPNEIQNNEQILQFQPISFEEERQELIVQSELSFGLNFINKFIYSLDENVLNTSNLLWYTRTSNPNQMYLFDQNNNIIIEIDHKNRNIWILKSKWDNTMNLFIKHPNINEINFNTLFRIYFMSDSTQLNILNRRLNSYSAFFNPLWLNTANYTINPTGEYAGIHWEIIKQELNIL